MWFLVSSHPYLRVVAGGILCVFSFSARAATRSRGARSICAHARLGVSSNLTIQIEGVEILRARRGHRVWRRRKRGVNALCTRRDGSEEHIIEACARQWGDDR